MQVNDKVTCVDIRLEERQTRPSVAVAFQAVLRPSNSSAGGIVDSVRTPITMSPVLCFTGMIKGAPVIPEKKASVLEKDADRLNDLRD